MPTPIINHERASHADDDPSHPIPYMGVVDIVAESKTGELKLLIVVASPLEFDPRSQTRLLDKIDGYLGYLASDEFLAEFGEPSLDRTYIIVRLHPDSDPAIHELLARCYDWVRDNNATFIVEELDP